MSRISPVERGHNGGSILVNNTGDHSRSERQCNGRGVSWSDRRYSKRLQDDRSPIDVDQEFCNVNPAQHQRCSGHRDTRPRQRDTLSASLARVRKLDASSEISL
jgi:hypothetical protein